MNLKNIGGPIVILAFSLISANLFAQTKLSAGEQPQLTVDSRGVVRLVYGQEDMIYFSTSVDSGRTFSKPQFIAQVKEMHLGMTRGPQLATSKDFSLVTAIDKPGNIHAFLLDHKTGKWQKTKNINDVHDSAPEGLMSVSVNNENKFFAVWLDLRNDKKNNICFSAFENGKWSPNKFIYRSPEGSVCECCKPSVEAKEKTVAVMFRNWLKGSRDLYLVTSTDGGKKFGDAQKLGNGTWPLKGCPMDGGGLSIDSKNQIHTAWQRDGVIYYAIPGKMEEKVGEGRSVSIVDDIVIWQKGSDLIIKKRAGEERIIGKGKALQLHQFSEDSILGVWEQDDQIVFSTL